MKKKDVDTNGTVRRPPFLLVGSFLAVFAAGLLVGVLFVPRLPSFNKEVAGEESVVRQGGYRFINPLLECELSEKRISEALSPFRSHVVQAVEKYKQEGRASAVAVYFRDLNNGPWFGIDEKVDFTPASLLKVPLMMAYFKKAESDKTILTNQLKYEGDDMDSSVLANTPPGGNLEIGKSYPIEELIRRIIVYSDNHAMFLLYTNVDKDFYEKVYSELGVSLPNENVQDNYMSVKQYASFFRILFNASYLNKEYSERALALLSEVEYKKGLVAGVPSTVTVSHKFGERSLTDLSQVQLHDCGVVYYPNHPYLLCVMTRGADYGNLSEVIKDVSKIVYGEVDKQFKP